MDKIYSFEGKLSRVVFDNQEGFKIASFLVKNENETRPLDECGISETFKGQMGTVKFGTNYIIKAKEIIDARYGKQYEVISLRTNFKMDTKEQQRIFFERILSPSQIKALFDTFENPVEILENKDYESLCAIKGIKMATALKMVSYYFANKDNSEAYVKLNQFGLTKRAIDKMVEEFNSNPTKLVDEITKNPYIVIDMIDGFGWQKADAMALNIGIGPTDTFRIGAFIKYFLKSEAFDKGDTWIGLQELREAIAETIPEATDEDVSKTLKGLMGDGITKQEVKYYPARDRIALTYLVDMEKNISEELKRIQNGKNLHYNEQDFDFIKEEIEDRQGWKFEEEQVLATKTILNNPVSIITGLAGCVDCDTEFFSQDGWKKISEYKEGDLVLQYNFKDKSCIGLVKPERYIKQRCNEFYHIRSKTSNFNVCFSGDHTIVYQKNEWDGGTIVHTNVKQFINNINTHEESVGYFINDTKCFPGLIKENEEHKWKTEIPSKKDSLIDIVKTENSYKYCFTMPKGYFMARRNGFVFVSKNCGKSSSLSLAVSMLSRYRIAQCSLSGRAASRMSEITGLEGYTIHRLLKMGPDSKEGKFNKSNPLPYDIVVVDETSMVDGVIFLKLLKAIPTGAKLIMLGDVHQLESIGICNLLNDMIASETIPSVKLEKIHRQAAKSGILTTASEVNNGRINLKNSIGDSFEIRGELQDLEILMKRDSNDIQQVILSKYEDMIKQYGITTKDIDIIVPMRHRGSICLDVLNERIQDLFIDKQKPNITIENMQGSSKKTTTFYEGDKIIITKNNYRICDRNGDEAPIYNGNLGYVKKISDYDDEIILDLFQQGEVVLKKSDMTGVNLGYAITCHAKQGSEIPYAIIGLDSSAYVLASREWIYTALTRAKKHCVLIGQPNIVNQAVHISRISKKRTWLKEFLKGEFEDEYKIS